MKGGAGRAGGASALASTSHGVPGFLQWEPDWEPTAHVYTPLPGGLFPSHPARWSHSLMSFGQKELIP